MMFQIMFLTGPARPGRDALGARLSAALSALVLAAALNVAAASGPARADTLGAALAAAESGDYSSALARSGALTDPVARKIIQWMWLKDGVSSFGTIAGFITANPDWPHQFTLRRAAERALTGNEDPGRLLSWFRAHPPLTTDGKVALAGAFLALGNSAEAARAARTAWIEGRFSQSGEQAFIARFGRFLDAEAHQERLSSLLWDERVSEARRMLPRVSSGHQALAQARSLLITGGGGVDTAIERMPASLKDDPGLVHDRLVWRRKRDMIARAAELLFHPSANQGDPESWGRERAYLGRELLQQGQARLAYRAFAGHGQSGGIVFATGEWTAGWIALRQLGDAATALRHFTTMHAGVSYPQSLSRGAYWAGRAAKALGRTDEARSWFRKAAEHAETFYGQLAIEELGEPLANHLHAAPLPSAADQARFNADERVRAVRLLVQAGFPDLAAAFARALDDDAATPGFRTLVGEFLRGTGRHDLAVAFARHAALSGTTLLEAGYPLPPGVRAGLDQRPATGPRPDPAVLLGLIRQESNFNTEAVSHAGARGLMQLMPRTAQRVALQLGTSSSTMRLVTDPAHNVQLGSAYFAGLLDEFRGSYVLAIAGYNAGPGRSVRWMRENGDPRRMDLYGVIDWIEHISFSETRNYVQRVLEGGQVYRHRLGEGAAVRLSDMLTR